MPVGRWWCSVVLGTLAITPLAAQSTPAGPGDDLMTHVAARPDDSQILVQGRDQKPTGWKRAETDHVVVFSDGSEAELVRVIGNLERLHALMSRLYGAAGQMEGAPKLQITLFDSPKDLEDLGLHNLRSQEGPFAGSFADQRYYDPRADGEVIAIARSDQHIDLNTNLARNRFCDEQAAEGLDCIGQENPAPPPIVRPWEAVLYSAFAQHFILSNAPAAYPRWYLDGIGALFSTINVKGNGSVAYADAPEFYKQVFYAYGDVNARDVLTGQYLTSPSRNMNWTPYHAWLITHFFVFSNPKPALRAQFVQYMAAVARGAPLAEAASVFGDLGELNRELEGYAAREKSFATAKRSDVPEQAPLVTLLSPAQVTVLKARIRLGDLPPVDAAGVGNGSEAAPWVDQVRGAVRQMPFDAEASLVTAEAECREGHPRECLADAEGVLARSPESARALAWKGVALTEQALAGPSGARADALAAARGTIAHALEIDPRDPVAAIAYFQSFAKAGEQVPEPAMASLAKVAASVPAAPRPRLLLGEELLRQGKGDLAQRLLKPVLYGAYDSPEKRAAQALFSRSASAAQPAILK